MRWFKPEREFLKCLNTSSSHWWQLYQIPDDLLQPSMLWDSEIFLNAALRYNSAVKTPQGDVKSFMCVTGADPVSAFALWLSPSHLVQLWLWLPLLKGILDEFIAKVSSNGTQLQHLTTHRWVTPFKIIVCPSKTNDKGRDMMHYSPME